MKRFNLIIAKLIINLLAYFLIKIIKKWLVNIGNLKQ